MDNIVYQMALARMHGMTIAIADEIIGALGSEDQFFGLPLSQIKMLLPDIRIPWSDADRKRAVKDAEKELRFIEKGRIRPLFYTNPDFPARLAECEDAPVVIYTFGDCNLNTHHMVSIVGTRHATNYGSQMTTSIVTNLAKKIDDVVIVSGLAYGIDITAHRAALDAGIPTIAVLANPLNTIYPASHRNDAVKMARSGGMLITEYPSDSHVNRGNFLARNRIIAGLSDCVLVVESVEHGGAMVTAKLAMSYGREVFAVPGRANDLYSVGCNKLIARDNAHLISSAEDIAEVMDWSMRSDEGSQQSLALDPSLSPIEVQIIETLRSQGEMTVNDLAARLGVDAKKMSTIVVGLEFGGFVTQIHGGGVMLK